DDVPRHLAHADLVAAVADAQRHQPAVPLFRPLEEPVSRPGHAGDVVAAHVVAAVVVVRRHLAQEARQPLGRRAGLAAHRLRGVACGMYMPVTTARRGRLAPARLRQAAAKSPAQAVTRFPSGSVRSPRPPASSWITSRMRVRASALITRPPGTGRRTGPSRRAA